MPKKIEVSHKTIIFTAIFIVSVWLLFQIKEIILILFIAIVLMSALNPLVRKMERFKLPRWLAILLIYIFVLLVFGAVIGGLVPPLVDQTTKLISTIPDFFKEFNFLGIDEKIISSQLAQLTSVPANIIKFIINIFSNLVQILFLAVMTFYLLLERGRLDHYLTEFFGEDKEKQIERVIDKIEFRLGGWIRGQFLLMLVTGILMYIGFAIVGIDYAVPLAILAFLFEVIPSFGSSLAAFPAILIALTISPLHALAIAGWAFLYQQLEHSIFAPRIMKSTTGINPLITIISLAIGLKLAGIGGALLAVPAYIVGQVIFSEISDGRKLKEN